MLRDFAAIDFETANEQLSSVCSIGIVVVRNGAIFERFYSLIRPEPEYYSYGNSCIHGLTLEDTAKARVFPEVWTDIEPIIGALPLVAHNKGFDEACLKAVFKTYRMDYPDYLFYCTLAESRRQLRHLPNHQLHTVAKDCGYDLANHHNALADAEACAEIAMQLL
ncbi:DNA polymerase III subunit epsilon [Dysgonomonas sp. 216]|uniref:3'-5' exonuclease n=1 Tax=Dysgonomonas sp. 216 TaxID=2302934 RepID=UPI0013D4DB62|nr:3'-5' exonuclease [Dysgonomonas sp. 216]NDW18513.1 DNA polymerase III subunit epsilon [Dysgonomonas sp. 216]